MIVKGSIGEKVLIAGTIDKIMIEDGHIEYSIHVDDAGFNYWADAENIIWLDKEKSDSQEINPPEASTPSCLNCMYQEKDAEALPCRDCNTSYDKFVFKEEPKRRGRPKKATVESLMQKCEEVKIKKEIENESNDD